MTDQEFIEQVRPVFAPKADDIELRAASNRDVTVSWKKVLHSLRENKPSPYLAPVWRKNAVTLIFWGGLGVNMQLASLTATAQASGRSNKKKGRDQASYLGKVTSQGRNDAELLSTAATARMHEVCSLLLARDSDAQTGHPFLPFNLQNPAAVAIIEKLTARVSKTDISVACKALTRYSLQCIPVNQKQHVPMNRLLHLALFADTFWHRGLPSKQS